MLNRRTAIALLLVSILALAAVSCININMPGPASDKNSQQDNQGTSPADGSGIPPAIETFSASPISLIKGRTSTLSWNVKNASSIMITPGIGTVSASGSREVKPDSAATYTIVAGNASGMTSQSVTITVFTVGKQEADFSLVADKKPDLAIKQLSVDQKGIIICTVENIGTASSKAAHVALDLKGSQVENADIPAIEPGKSVTFTYLSKIAKGMGTTSVTATVDRKNIVEESNENNNSVTITYTP